MHRYKLAAAACRDASVQTNFVNHQTPATADDGEISTNLKAELTQLQKEKQVWSQKLNIDWCNMSDLGIVCLNCLSRTLK